MVQAGITPPNVRTDIDDNPPDPSRPLSAPQMPPKAKVRHATAAAALEAVTTVKPDESAAVASVMRRGAAQRCRRER